VGSGGSCGRSGSNDLELALVGLDRFDKFDKFDFGGFGLCNSCSSRKEGGAGRAFEKRDLPDFGVGGWRDVVPNILTV